MEDLNGMSDKELVELASVGEMKAIEVLYSRHYELLLNFGKEGHAAECCKYYCTNSRG